MFEIFPSHFVAIPQKTFVYSAHKTNSLFLLLIFLGGSTMDIEKTFPTGTPADQMKEIMINNVLSRQDVQMFFGDTSWEGNTLKFSSGLVSEGQFDIVDNEVKVAVALSMFGKMAKSQIEGTLEKTFSKLPA